ncbi:MAG TPA: MarR family transcriptional regulator, partial [Clostridia bacterium]|nr:MarR family transcriptional regulator [Clostridia bacterium]
LYLIFKELNAMDVSTGRKIFDLLNEVNSSFHKNLEEYFAKWSLTASQILVLTLLDKHEEMKISEIAARMGFADSNVSGIVDRLENAGFVGRTRSTEDRRIVKVSLADKALELKKEFDLSIEEYFNQFLKRTSQEELDSMVTNLEKLKQLLSRKDIFTA